MGFLTVVLWEPAKKKIRALTQEEIVEHMNPLTAELIYWFGRRKGNKDGA